MRVVLRVAVLVMMSLAACGDPAARVELAPISPCGQVDNESALRIVAYTAGGEQRRTVPPTQIDAFPADTEQLGAEVIGESGRIVAVGKTASIEFNSLETGTSIPIVMAPLDDVCPVGPLTEPRARPALARAGDFVLIVGGTGGGGEQVATAELYDPATTTFSPVSVPSSLLDAENGLAGAVLTELPGGRVALSGTASHALAIFDPETRRFSAPILFDRRAFHGAFGVAANRLLVIGGCAEVVAGACAGPSLRSGFVYDLDDVTMRERGPALDGSAIRYGARVFDLGEQADGARRFVLAGGTGDPDVADRFALVDAMAERITGVHAQVTALDGGALLSVTDTAASVLAPAAVAAVAIAPPPVSGAGLVTLEDGSILAVGAEVARYIPTSNTWRTLSVALPALAAPSLVRLADGSVLILGGAPTAEAWIYRPSLVGRNTGALTIGAGITGDGVLVLPDPARVDRSDGLALVADGDNLAARALVGGPRMSQGSISAVSSTGSAGVALIAQQTSSGNLLVGRLVPGEPARIVEHTAGIQTVLCAGTHVAEAELTGPVNLAISGGVASLSVGAQGAQTVKATCEVPTAERGQWGVAAVGPGARYTVDLVIVTRTR